MEIPLEPVRVVLERADEQLRTASEAPDRIWPTGFDLLDKTLTGGLRSGELVLLGGPQGLGKTTWVLQVARTVARAGRPVLVFSFEHDAQTLMVRLVAQEAGHLGGIVAPSANRIRATFEDNDGRSGSVSSRLADTECGVEAVDLVAEYGDRLLLHRSTGTSTGLDTIAAAIAQVRERTGTAPLVVVDYLQKVHVPGATDEHAKTTVIAEGLKDLALDHEVPVVAVVAADKEGLAAGKRLRVGNLRGSSALAYEADTVLVLNEKYDVVARHPHVNSKGHVETLKKMAVLTVEKNRSGRSGVDMEFLKRFDQCRFDPVGRQVAEQLVDERVFVE